jgi:hypothetical protein
VVLNTDWQVATGVAPQAGRTTPVELKTCCAVRLYDAFSDAPLPFEPALLPGVIETKVL